MTQRLPLPGRLPCGPDGRPAEEIIIRFVCVNAAHVASTVPGKLGSLVTHSGTCGYCPGQAVLGAHAWKNNVRITLADLLKRSHERASSSPPRRRSPGQRTASRRGAGPRAGTPGY